jgi:sulfate adenylyltransferase
VTISEQTVTGPRGGLPHGGQLVDRRLDAEEASALASGRLPSLPLTAAEAADLRALATGAYSPLTGFMGAKEHESVTESMRLPDGTLWSIPVCLGIPDGVRVDDGRLALRGPNGGLLGVLEVTEVFERDRAAEAELVYGTTDPEHPGVARVLGAPGRAVAGPVQAVVTPLAGPVGERALTPAETRAAFASRGWSTVVGFQTRNPVHRAHEYLMKCALEMVDGLLLHPLVGPTKEGDVPAEVRMRAYEAVLGYFPPERVLLSALVAPMRYAGPREAVLHALVRKNYGCTHFIVGRDHAGVGSYYGTFEAQ